MTHDRNKKGDRVGATKIERKSARRRGAEADEQHAIDSEPGAIADARSARVGTRLRAMRIARNLTIAQVAEGAGVTKGFVSRLERNQTSVSIAALLRICDVLHTPVTAIFEDAPDAALVRAGEGALIDFGGGLRQMLQTPAHVSDVRVFKLLIAPGASAGREAYSLHGGTEFIQVQAGKFEMQLEGELHLLGPGDCITFAGSTPHTYRNPGREPCEAMLVIAPAP